MPLPEDDRAVVAFEQHRARLIRVAHGMLGSISEAEDVVQDAWFRLERTDTREVDHLGAWLMTTVGRLALDTLGSARRRRESYVGEWLPEPLVEAPADDPTLDDKVSTALLVVLERLSPAERAAFILHDVFDLPFDEVAEVVGRTPAAVRQLASRARRRVEEGRPRFPVSREEQERVAHAFASAWQLGDLDQLLSTLDPEVVLRSDGGGRVSAAGRPLLGANRVARALLAFKRGAVLSGREIRSSFADVNGAPGLVLAEDDRLSVVSLTVDRGRIVAVDIVRNPDKLRHVEKPAQ